MSERYVGLSENAIYIVCSLGRSDLDRWMKENGYITWVPPRDPSWQPYENNQYKIKTYYKYSMIVSISVHDLDYVRDQALVSDYMKRYNMPLELLNDKRYKWSICIMPQPPWNR